MWNKIVEISNEIKNWIINNSNNPFLWVGIILVCLIIFELVFQSLKNK